MTRQRHQHQNSAWQDLVASLHETQRELFSEHPRFRYRGKSYTVRSAGRRLLHLIRDWKWLMAKESGSSLELRGEIRAASASPPPVLLSYLLQHANEPNTIRMILLIARRGRVHAATKVVFSKYENADQRVRRDVVRTLLQLSAWRELRIVGKKCEYEDTRQLATARQRPSFETRLQRFSNTTRHFPACNEQQELIVPSEVELSGGRPPRTGTQIARLLRSIQRLIRRARHRRRLLFCKSRSL